MQHASPNPYLRTQVMTAGPMQLRLLLYDGALKFCRNARQALADEDYEQSYHNFTRTQSIVMELSNSLDHNQAPELCDRLSALYNYLYRRLVEANLRRDPAILDEVVELLEYERETWILLMEQMGQSQAGDQTPQTPGSPPAAAQSTSTLSRSA